MACKATHLYSNVAHHEMHNIYIHVIYTNIVLLARMVCMKLRILRLVFVAFRLLQEHLHLCEFRIVPVTSGLFYLLRLFTIHYLMGQTSSGSA